MQPRTRRSLQLESSFAFNWSEESRGRKRRPRDYTGDTSPETRIKEIVMAKVIEFYVPKNFRNSFARAAQPQPGRVIEFFSQAKKSVPVRPALGGS